MTKWAREKLSYHNWAYGEFYRYSIEMNQSDDRRLYINIYNNIEEAINEVSTVQNTLVRVALNKEIKESYETLKAIQKTFWDKFQANIA